jgi:hypothetical protein
MMINLDTAKREISEMVEMEQWLLLEKFGYELVDEVKRLREALDRIDNESSAACAGCIVSGTIARAALNNSTTKENQ